jgi:four helix bundle protein
MASSFRELVAYRLAAELGDQLARDVAAWESFERWSTGIQLVRSVDSIGANIAEALGRWHTKDRRHLLIVARGSLYETEHWLIRAEARGLMREGTAAALDEVARALNGLIKRAPPS